MQTFLKYYVNQITHLRWLDWTIEVVTLQSVAQGLSPSRFLLFTLFRCTRLPHPRVGNDFPRIENVRVHLHRNTHSK